MKPANPSRIPWTVVDVLRLVAMFVFSSAVMVGVIIATLAVIR